MIYRNNIYSHRQARISSTESLNNRWTSLKNKRISLSSNELSSLVSDSTKKTDKHSLPTISAKECLDKLTDDMQEMQGIKVIIFCFKPVIYTIFYTWMRSLSMCSFKN